MHGSTSRAPAGRAAGAGTTGPPIGQRPSHRRRPRGHRGRRVLLVRCPHCYNFEPKINDWKQSAPNGVVFKYIPAVFRPVWELHARAFYAAKFMGVLHTFHDAMFEAIHEQGRRLDSREALGQFVSELGLHADRFLKNLDSFAVDVKIRRAKELQKAYGHLRNAVRRH
ncbi:MAG: thiol:disulfide interchange protein DsbA/DsbL [Halofilum sp. (in: g-proteobacteria)]|nr:thiol:disulfide interchange protein DsbA/DsbL [Halofilum sp. (in: g-proteobacteria)]